MSDEYGRLRRFYRDISGASIVAAGDTAKTCVAARNASHSIFVQKMALRLTSADANRTWNVGDAADVSATGEVDLTTAPLSLPFDFGPTGLRLSQGEDLSLTVLSRLRAAILAKNPLAYWPSDDVGPTLADASGNNKTATFDTNTAGVTFGVAGGTGDGHKGIAVDGLVQHQAKFTPIVLAANAPFSIVFLLKASALDIAGDGFGVVIGQSDGDGNAITLTNDGTAGAGLFVALFNLHGAHATYNATALAPGVRHLMGVTFDGIQARWYTDGVLDTFAGGTYAAGDNLSVGALFSDDLAERLSASLVQHVAVIPSKLSDADMAALAAVLTGTSPAGVIAWEGYERLTSTIAAGAGSD